VSNIGLAMFYRYAVVVMLAIVTGQFWESFFVWSWCDAGD